MSAQRFTAVLTLVLSAITTSPNTFATDDFVWVEGEDARSQSVKRHGWYDSVTKRALSGNEWLSHFGGGDAPEAEYRLEVPSSGRYAFWVRCNVVGRARLSYRLGRGAWTEIDTSKPLGNVNIAADGKPDLRFVAWVKAGEVRLSRGEEKLRFRFHSENQNHGAIDCFVFAPGSFRPRGSLKPGERSGLAQPGFFAWEPDVDGFGDNALVDLSHLNEDVAGEKGRVRASGNDFVLGDGSKVKFWAANAGPGIWGLDHESHVYLARRLAKCGVNMVRLHGSIYGSRNPAVEKRKLDDLHHLVHAMKSEGIYVTLSFFFPLWFHLDGDQRPFMLLFFDEEMQEIYYRWADALLTSPNPYTGQSLGKDPAVAIVEIINEDSHFFWTFGKKNMPERRWKKLQALYGDWLRRKHGSLRAALESWGGVKEAGDVPRDGRVELYGAWEMTREGVKAKPKHRARVGDQVQFLTENMRGFYEQTISFFREKCQYRGLVSCGNWHVSDAEQLDALERYCYTAGDVIDYHGYFDRGHEGEAANYSVRPGQKFRSESALSLEGQNPLPHVQTEGFPQITSEIGWPAPNMYRAESTFLTAAYGSLQGIDGIFHFAISSAGWEEQISKFGLSSPVTLGSFPAAALIYRGGYVAQAPTVVMDHVRLEDLYALKGTPVSVGGAFDEFRAADIPEGRKKRGVVEGIDPLTFYVGRVARSFKGAPDDSYQRSVEQFIDRRGKTVKSVTGELVLDYGRGVAELDTPKAQGAAGFLAKAGALELADVTIEMRNDYGAMLVVALDDQPLARSSRILIQTLTVEQFHGFEASGSGNASGRIEQVGSAPPGVERIDATVTLKSNARKLRRVIACDEHGYPTERSVRVSANGTAVSVTLDATSPYHVVLR